MNDEPRETDRAPATATIHRSSARGGDTGWTVTASSAATAEDVERAVDLAVAGHRRLMDALQRAQAVQEVAS